MVTHPSTNRTRRIVTLLEKTNTVVMAQTVRDEWVQLMNVKQRPFGKSLLWAYTFRRQTRKHGQNQSHGPAQTLGTCSLFHAI